MSLWVVRHAQPLIEPGICYGALDVPADPIATQQAARALAQVLPHGAVLQTSVLQRCEQLRQAICGLRPDLTHQPEPRLVEMNFGIYEGVAWVDISKDALDAWTQDFAQHRFGGQESVAEFMTRVAAVWDECLAEPREDRVWITHAGVARSTLLLAQGIRVPRSAQQWPAGAPAFGQWMEVIC
ncbi:histidine phosphatase family protein [Janthinobacterium sp.]|uniref:histidine phosphatase family protein n=1 Tax=Janthinobacterium sp. TaxID=1871054 RepID=UPI00293D7041|nr:histidine phosphatase family protein [Janthinobacterium sp.]